MPKTAQKDASVATVKKQGAVMKHIKKYWQWYAMMFMDFGETGCCGIRITGRSPLPANTVHLMFAAADGGETERRVVEFGPQADWGEQTFTFEPVTGARQVTFLFLPGTQFDFDSFTFI